MEFLGIPVEHWKEVGFALAFVAGSAIVGRLVLFVLDRYISRLTRRTPTSFDDALMDAARMPVFWAIVFAGLALGLNQLSFLPSDWRETQAEWMFVPYWLIAWVLIHRLANNLLQWYGHEMARRTLSPVDEEVVPFIRRLVIVVVAAIALIVLLSHFGVDVTALITSLGIASLAIALAAQSTLADWITGFVIILDRPFKIGDRIELLALDTWGDVQDIGLQSTRVRTRDNRMVVVPNSVIGKNLVVNHSYPSTVYRVQTHVSVGYGTDIARARQIMIDAVRAQDWVMKDERIEALFLQFGESAMIFRVRCWIEHYVETRRIMDKLNTCLYEALHEASIEMPAPERALYHRVAPEDRDGLLAVLRESHREA